MQPFNYRQQVVNPFQQAIESTTQGFKLGASIRDVQEQRAAAEEAKRRSEQLTNQMNALVRNPNPTWEDYEAVATFLPKDAADSLRANFKIRNEEQQKETKKFSGQVAAALLSPNAESRQRGIALLLQRAEAERNAGNIESADAYELHAKVAESGASGAKAAANEIIILGGVTFGKDWAQSILDVEKGKREESQQDFDRMIKAEELRIKKLEADLKREDNALKRQELVQKIDEAKKTRDEKSAERVSQANTVLATFDNAINSIDGLLKNWGRDQKGNVDVKKPNTTVETATGPISSRIPTIRQDTADFEEMLASLESQAFLSQVDRMRGLGALTEREGARLVNALGSLSLRQSPEQLGRNLLEIQRLMLKARTEMERKYGVSMAPDRPAGPGGSEVPPPQVPSAMGQATSPAMPSGFRVLGRETPR